MMTMVDGYPDDFEKCEFFGGSLDGTLQIVPRYMLVDRYKFTNFGPFSQREVYIYNVLTNTFNIDRDVF